MSTRTLTTIRDAAIVAASAVVTVFAAGELVDSVTARLRRRNAPGTNPLALNAPHGWLNRVGGGVGSMSNPVRRRRPTRPRRRRRRPRSTAATGCSA